MKYHNSLFIFLAATGICCTSAENGFSEKEKMLIGSGGDGIMRVLTIDNESDSLFLREKSTLLPESVLGTGDFNVLRQRMLATVLDPENTGVGIAAPQIGIGRRIIAVQRFDIPGQPFGFYVNPVITKYSDETRRGPEGCLSIPETTGDVDRAASIEITYLDPDTGKTISETIEGFTAVIFQHEVDHLEGMLFTDKIVTDDNDSL